MTYFPLLLSFGSLLAWVLLSLVLSPRRGASIFFAGLAFSLAQLVSATLTLLDHWDNPQPVVLLLPFLEKIFFQKAVQVGFRIDFGVSLYWLLAAIFLFFRSYFFLLETKNNNIKPTETLSLPLMFLGALTVILSGNLFTLGLGLFIVSIACFLTLSFANPKQDKTAQKAILYFTICFLGNAFVLWGILETYFKAGTTDFSFLATQFAGPGATSAVVLLIVGFMIHSFQIPLRFAVQHVCTKGYVIQVLFFGHLLLLPSVFIKLHPIISSIPEIRVLAIVPVLTMLAASVQAIFEKDKEIWLGCLFSYVTAGIFFSGLTLSFQTIQSVSLTGTIAIFFFANAWLFALESQKAIRWLFFASVLSILGLPVFGLGWARSLEYSEIFQLSHSNEVLDWFFTVSKVGTDILMGVAAWGVLRTFLWSCEPKLAKQRVAWAAFFPLLLLFLGALTPVLLIKNQNEALSWTWGSPLFVIFLSIILGQLVLFRDQKTATKTREFCRKNFSKLAVLELVWTHFFGALISRLQWLAVETESRAVPAIFGGLYQKPTRRFLNGISKVETTLLDKVLINGISTLIEAIGKILRLVHCGQVQLYYYVGLLLLSAIISHYIFFGGN